MLRMLFLCFPKDRVQKQHFGIGFTLFSLGPLTKKISQTMTFQLVAFVFLRTVDTNCMLRMLFLCFPKDRMQKQHFGTGFTLFSSGRFKLVFPTHDFSIGFLCFPQDR